MYRNAVAVWKGPTTDASMAVLRAAQPGCLNTLKRLMAVSQNSFREAQLPEVTEENVKCGALLAQHRGEPGKGSGKTYHNLTLAEK